MEAGATRSKSLASSSQRSNRDHDLYWPQRPSYYAVHRTIGDFFLFVHNRNTNITAELKTLVLNNSKH
jgi:hypothetical protein